MSRRCSNRHPKRIPGPVFFGLILMGAGCAVLAHNLGFLSFDAMFTLWPAIFVLSGLVRLVNCGPLNVGGHIQLMIGIILLGGFNNYAPEVEKFWPLSLVWVGLVVLARALIPAQEVLPPAPSFPQDEESRQP